MEEEQNATFMFNLEFRQIFFIFLVRYYIPRCVEY